MTPNPSIERTSPGKPGLASHIKLLKTCAASHRATEPPSVRFANPRPAAMGRLREFVAIDSGPPTRCISTRPR